jgi:signal transduction histidine kinase
LIFADPDRVRQVLVNLIGNAVGYGRTRVAVVARRDNGSVIFSVHDDGDGVPLKHQVAFFERFERGDHTFDISIPGSGIGLSVARDLVTAHGGIILYRSSDLLGGACFEFTIPVPRVLATELESVDQR